MSNQTDKLIRRNFDVSFNELLDMYREKELVIRPDFQRLFRWSIKQQSMFIESLLLDMPVPPIYVDEQSDSTYVLVDGLQRISSYLHFRGALDQLQDVVDDSLQILSEDNEYFEDSEDEYFYADINPGGFTLDGCEILTELNGKTYEDLSVTERLQLKRNFIRVEVLTKENPSEMKYHMFKRLNSGGLILSKQELRNSNIRMINEDFINLINKLSEDENFVNLTKYMRKSEIQEMKRQENVLRFFFYKDALSKENARIKLRFDEELTKYLEDVSLGTVDFDYEKEERLFLELVSYLNEQFGPELFARYSQATGRNTNTFVIANYDGFMQYFANHNGVGTISLDDINNIKVNERYLSYRTGGIDNVRSRVGVITGLVGDND